MRRFLEGGSPRTLPAGLVLALAVGPASGQQDESLAVRVRLREALAAHAVRRAVGGAGRRLQDPQCRAVFSDFADTAGRSLQARLDEHGLTADAYLARVFFYDGSEQKVCSARGILAATEPGNRVVHICAQSFLQKQRQNPYEAENVIIHEVLHTLGLQENPPSSSEISARITSRCGR